ncbi:hypothetical protein R0135_01305 [Congregibacter variabilis]|uniref:DUF4760 domain-containing protein n=1 Tax=Congregibacter variabilis TaxID=3081200 RepID=A0ABZ0I3W4_9GAMM|nr:hypothetical protein R0135_01305 [Congregibacter sp. IMCC43200]
MKRFGLAEWAHVAEIVGGVAVIVSLLFVGFQVRENTIEIKAASRNQLIGRAHEATKSFATNLELAQTMAKVSDKAPLTKAERVQYSYVLKVVLYDVQEAFVLNQEGRLGPEFWATRANLVQAYLNNPIALDMYRDHRADGTLLPAFTHWIDTEVLKVDFTP